MNEKDMNTIQSLNRRLKQTAIIVFSLLLTVSCTDERYNLGTGDDDVPEGMVRITLSPTIEAAGTVTTRTAPSAADIALTGTIYVLVFDGTTHGAVLLQKPAVAAYASDKLKATLNQQTSDCYLYVVANITAAEKTYLDGLGAGATMGEVAAELKHRLRTTPSYNIGFPLPMSGISEATKLIKTATTTPLTVSIPLTRSVARIDIDGSAVVSGFQIHGASVANGAPYGYTMPQTLTPSFGITELVSYEQIDMPTPANTMTDLLFCYENAGSTDEADSRATRVVIKGQPAGSTSPTYYPIDIIYNDPLPTGKTLAHVERNKCYTIKFTQVDIDGYRTPEEAVRSESFNNRLDVDIVVTDPYAHDITTNGKQFLGVTNSEFVLYPREYADKVEYVHIASFSYTCDPGWAAGEITLPPGLEFSAGAGQKRIEVSPSVAQRDIIVNVAKSADFTEGVIVLHIGNLRKEIKVRRKEVTLPTGDMLEDYFVAPDVKENFKVGEIIAPTADTKWLQVSSSPDVGLGGTSVSDKVTNPAGGIYIHLEPNAGFNGSALPREASLYISGEKDDQRIKVMVQQKAIDVYSEAQQIGPYSYAGTFHRWNETGERLIRIDANEHFTHYDDASGNIWWEATVIAGRDFIVLDQTLSPDNGRVQIGNPPSTLNAFGDASSSAVASSAEVELFQVNSIKRTVKGANGNIYFRVGLIGKLAGPEAQPRYGLIGITYGDGATRAATTKTQTHFIYVRQGEAADYVMRPWDPSTKPLPRIKFNGLKNDEVPLTQQFFGSARPAAVKFSPYNLTSPQPVPNVARGYRFVDHPSQGGYYFAPLAPFAFGPMTVEGVKGLPQPTANLSVAPTYTATDVGFMESCPPGYRRPDVGSRISPVGSSGAGANLSLDDISMAEMLQSLFLYPKKQIIFPDLSNQLRGYLADGFFDRRKISLTLDNVIAQDYRIPAKGNETVPLAKAKGIVRSDFQTNNSEPDAGMALWGYITFNPYNYASIFLPFTGNQHAWIPTQINDVGGAGNLHSSSRINVLNNLHLRIGFTSLGTILGYNDQKYTFDINYTGSNYGSIRCVKDENPPIGTGGGSNDSKIEETTPSNPDDSQLAIRQLYDSSRPTGTLQEQIEADYNTVAQRKRINSITISGNRGLEAADYIYLNAWAEGSNNINGTDYSGTKLRHLIIRGAGNLIIPAGAFTSSKWSSVSLRDASEIKATAFSSAVVQNSSGVITGMRNLYLGCLDDMTIAAGAFGFNAPWVQLHIQGVGSEYTSGRISGKKWTPTGYGSAIEWSAIKAEY